jgi:hypothetical protein
MRFEPLLMDFVADNGWNDTVETFEEEGLCRLAVGLRIGGRSFRLLLEGYERQQWLVLSLYAPFTASPETVADLSLLFNFLNGTFSYPGHLSVDDDGVVDYRQIADFGGIDAGVAIVHNMLHAAADMFERNGAAMEMVASGNAGYADARRAVERESASREEP